HITGRVVAHRFHINILENVERLQQRGPLRPRLKLVDLYSLVSGFGWLLDLNLPVREVSHREETALLLHAAHELPRDVSFIEAVVRRVDRLLPRFASRERLLLGLDQLSERRRKICLPEDLACFRCFARFTEMRK